VIHEAHWSFAHNLLSMTGAFTLQPFVSEDRRVVAMFNGEIYNYRSLAKELAGAEDAYPSDGFSILPAYEKWGPAFPSHMEGELAADFRHAISSLTHTSNPGAKVTPLRVRSPGEFAIVLVDFRAGHVLLSTDVFSTKPLWYAPSTHPSPRSIFDVLGAPHRARHSTGSTHLHRAQVRLLAAAGGRAWGGAAPLRRRLV